MFAEERKDKIIQMVERDHIVRVTELSCLLDTTEATIRRDLEELQNQGIVRRIHGGAVFTNKTNRDFHYSELSVLHIDEKKRIASKAFEFIHNNDTLLFDASTTVYELAKIVCSSNLNGISIITNSFNLVNLFAGSDKRIVHTGGELSSNMYYAVGTITEQMLQDVRVDKCFIGTNGIETSYGYSVPNFNDASVKKCMLKAAKHSFVLADHTKFGESYMAKFANYINEVDYLITDTLPADVYLNSCSHTKILLADEANHLAK